LLVEKSNRLYSDRIHIMLLGIISTVNFWPKECKQIVNWN